MERRVRRPTLHSMFDLEKVAGAAVSTAGLVIAASIFAQMLATKFIASFERFRALAGELRSRNGSGARLDSLRHQVSLYRRRCHHLRRASFLMMATELSFIITIVAAAVTVAFKGPTAVAIIGAITMVTGFACFAAATVLDTIENHMSRRAIETELHDLNDLDPAGQRLHEGSGAAPDKPTSPLRPRHA